MLIIKKGETANKSTNVNVAGNFVDCVHSTVHKSLNDGERFQMEWSLNFDEMTQEQIMEAAAEHFIIKIRRDFAKSEKPQDVDWNNATFQVVEYISRRISKIDKMAKTLADFSDEQLAALGLSRT